jgi:hypothetical protein
LKPWPKLAQIPFELVAELGALHDYSFSGMENARVKRSYRLPPKFQRKVWQAR